MAISKLESLLTQISFKFTLEDLEEMVGLTDSEVASHLGQLAKAELDRRGVGAIPRCNSCNKVFADRSSLIAVWEWNGFMNAGVAPCNNEDVSRAFFYCLSCAQEKFLPCRSHRLEKFSGVKGFGAIWHYEDCLD